MSRRVVKREDMSLSDGSDDEERSDFSSASSDDSSCAVEAQSTESSDCSFSPAGLVLTSVSTSAGDVPSVPGLPLSGKKRISIIIQQQQQQIPFTPVLPQVDPPPRRRGCIPWMGRWMGRWMGVGVKGFPKLVMICLVLVSVVPCFHVTSLLSAALVSYPTTWEILCRIDSFLPLVLAALTVLSSNLVVSSLGAVLLEYGKRGSSCPRINLGLNSLLRTALLGPPIRFRCSAEDEDTGDTYRSFGIDCLRWIAYVGPVFALSCFIAGSSRSSETIPDAQRIVESLLGTYGLKKGSRALRTSVGVMIHDYRDVTVFQVVLSCVSLMASRIHFFELWRNPTIRQRLVMFALKAYRIPCFCCYFVLWFVLFMAFANHGGSFVELLGRPLLISFALAPALIASVALCQLLRVVLCIVGSAGKWVCAGLASDEFGVRFVP